MGKFKFGKRSREKLDGVDERVKRLCEKALKYSTVDFSVIDGLRTQSEQKAMFDKGVSELDGQMFVSDHQLGLAIDVIPYVDGLDPWDVDNDQVKLAYMEMYRAFMRASMKLGMLLEFGFGYNIGGGRDMPHISVKQM